MKKKSMPQVTRKRITKMTELEEQLFDAVYNHDVERVNKLIAQGVNIDARDKEGYSPLHIAKMINSLSVVEALLAAGADYYAKPRVKGARKGRPVDTDIEFAKLVKTKRILLGISQKAIAGVLNVTVQQIQKYESAKNRMSINVACLLCPLLKISMDNFINGKSADHKELTPLDISEKEISKIINKYSHMSQKKREYVIKFINSIAA